MKVLIRSIIMLMIIMMMTPSIASVGAIVGTGDEEIREFNDKAVNDFIEEFSVKKHTFDTLSIPVYHPYMIFANVDSFSQKEKNKDWAIDKASWMLDRDLKEEDYVKILISVIELNELSAIDQVDNQHIYDEKYDFGDKWLKSYYKDTMETVLACFNIPEGDLIGKINDVLESIKDGSEAIISSVDGGKYFNLMLQSYAFSQRFLSAIIDNSDNEYLKKAAESLQDAGKKVFEKKIDYFLENSKNITVYGWKQFLKLSYKDLYSSYKNSVDSITTEFLLVSCGKSLYEAKEKYIGGYWEFFFNLMMIGGDFSFATSDTFSIYQELKILCDIAQSLERANSKLTIEDIGSIYDQYNVIYEKCEYYKLLITVDARAEHLTHEMLGNEHNLLSYFDYFTDLIKGEETEDERHEKKNQEILEIDALLNDLVSINVYGRTVYDLPDDAIDKMLPLVNAQVNFFRYPSEEDYHVTSCKNEDDFWNTFGSYCNSNIIPGNDSEKMSSKDGKIFIERSRIIDMGYALFDDFDGAIPDTEFGEYSVIQFEESSDIYTFSPASMHDYIYKEKSEPEYNDDGTITITYLYEESFWPDRDAPETFAYDITFRVNDHVNESSDNPYYYTIISVQECATLPNEGEQETMSFDPMISTVASGECGDNLTWTLDDEGTLAISGSGKMPWFFPESNAPWYSNRLSIKKIIIEDGITSIGDGAFENCSNLTSIELPNSLTMIGYYAFSYCNSLTSITLPNSLTSIGDSAFNECTSLVSITLPEGITSIDSGTFYGCTKLTSIILSDGVTGIWYSAFSGCNSLKSITLPKNLMSIRDHAFEDCNSLTEIYFQGTAPNIENEAFLHISATAYYPSNDSTWTSDVKQNYGGNITWVEWD